MYLPPLVLFNPLWGMNEGMNIFSISLSLVISLSLSISLPLNVEPHWEGGGAILGTTPHPAMLLDAHYLSHHHALHHPLYYTMSIFIINNHRP